MQERLTPERWYRLRRLELAGVRLPSPLQAPNHPVRVEQLPPITDYNLFPVHDGIGVALPVRITGGTRITIGAYRLHWGNLVTAAPAVKPLAPCARCSSDYVPHYCFDTAAGHETIRLSSLQKEKVWAGGILNRDTWLQGCFSGVVSAPLRFASLLLDGTLEIVDVMGNEYPYPVYLKVSPELELPR